MCDSRVYNEYTVQLARKLAKSENVKKIYVKIIDNIPHTVYSFFVIPEIKSFYKGVLHLSFKQKTKYINFWSEFDKNANTVTSNTTLVLDIDNTIPAADYIPPEIDLYK